MFWIELDEKKLQNLAIKVDRILREEIKNSKMKCEFLEARVYNIKTVGVQGDKRTYAHPAEITLTKPEHSNGTKYNREELNIFLEKLSNRITNEIRGVNRVLYVTADRDDRIELI